MGMHNRHQKQFTDHRISDMKLTSSASDQNVFFTYVCLVNEVKPSFTRNDDMNSSDRGLLQTSFHIIQENADENIQEKPIQVERSKALHELVEPHKHDRDDMVVNHSAVMDKSIDEDSESDTEDFNHYVNPNKLKLTKMKWLSEGRAESPDSSSPYLTPKNSLSSIGSGEYDDTHDSYGEKCLSTILRLDREHNMFGMSNIAIVGKKMSKKKRKEDNKPVFPQTAIIQICCGGGCCRHKSKTDLPPSLKCSGCQSCCVDPCCRVCAGSCGPPCDDPPTPCPSRCLRCPIGKCICKRPCLPSKCRIDCNTCYGMKISFKRKTKFDPSPNELTPRSSCILQKPMACRSCHHLPQCIPPSSCFPYLMPCYWPVRPGAPCNDPSRCFHNPPCRPPRKRKSCIPPDEVCPKHGKCESENEKCSNQACPGQNPIMKEAIESRFGNLKI